MLFRSIHRAGDRGGLLLQQLLGAIAEALGRVDRVREQLAVRGLGFGELLRAVGLGFQLLGDNRGNVICRQHLAGLDLRSFEIVLVLGELGADRSEEHTSELQSLMRNSYAVFCWKTKTPKMTTSDH